MSFEDKIKTAILTYSAKIWEVSEYNTEGKALQQTKDYIIELLEEQIDQVIKDNLPDDEQNLTISEKRNTMYYRLACEDIRAKFHE